ncbi:MAG: acetyltransferase [Planctomycetota bacterium]
MPDDTRPPVKLTLVGGGGHALVVADAALRAGLDLHGFFDDDPDAPIAAGTPSCEHLGDLTSLEARELDGSPWILALGDLTTRRWLIDRLYKAEDDAAMVIHPDATISESAVIAGGVWVGPRAVVHTRARVLDHAIINSGAIVEHDCLVSENAHIAPGATLGGNVSVGNNTLVGLNATVLPGVTIGSGCTVGAGAVVTRDVQDQSVVVGVPASQTSSTEPRA